MSGSKTQSRFIAIVSFLIARRWVKPQTHCLRVALVRWLVPYACLWLGQAWLNMRFSLALTICES